jgi:hypothetical protein
LLERVKEHEQWVAQRKTQGDAAANPTGQTAVANAPRDTQTMTASSKAIPLDTLMAVEGLVRGIDCSHKPGITVTLSGGNRPLIFHAADFGAVGVTGAGEGALGLDSCEKWKGRRIRIWFRKAQGKEYLGEITDLAFM